MSDFCFGQLTQTKKHPEISGRLCFLAGHRFNFLFEGAKRMLEEGVLRLGF